MSDISKIIVNNIEHNIVDALAQERIDNLITSGDVLGEETAMQRELGDIRVAFDGMSYTSAGNAVRGQVSQLNTKINDVKSEIADLKENGPGGTGATEERIQQIETNKNNIEKLSEEIAGLGNKVSSRDIVVEKKGSSITANDSTYENLKGLNVYGESTQRTTTGKNLLENTASSVVKNGVTFTINEDKSVTVNGTATEQTDFNIIGSWSSTDNILDTGKEYIITGTNDTNVRFYGSYNSSNVFSLTNGEAEKTYINNTGLSCVYIRIVSGTTVSNKIVYPMIRLASITDATYEPYTNGASPNPEYPQEVESCENTEVSVHNKNLFSPDTNGYVNNTTGGITSTGVTSVRASSEYLPCKTNMTAIIKNYNSSDSNAYAYRVAWYDSEKNWIKNNSLKDAKTALKAPVNAKYFRASEGYVDTLMICYDDADEYEESNKQSLTIPYTLCGIPVTNASLANYTDDNGQGWVSDGVDMERGVYVQRIKKEVYNGTESWVKYGEKQYGIPVAQIGVLKNSACLCTHFIRGTNAENSFFVGGSGVAFNTEFNTINEFKAWLAEQYANDTPVTTYYILSTPIETQLTADEIAAYKALHSNYPNTAVLNNNGAGMKLKYVADTKLYIDNKFADLVAQIV